jgi:hypothetical protein
MSLSNFTLSKLTEQGTWVHLTIDGKPLYLQEDKQIALEETDKPVRVHLKSVADPAVSKALKDMTKAQGVQKWAEERATADTIASVIDKHSAEVEARVKALLGAAIDDWENVSIGDPARLAVADDRSVVLGLVGVNTPFWLPIYKALMGQQLVFKNAASD